MGLGDMSYRTILIVFRHKEQSETLARIASMLTDQHGAHVVGLFVVPHAELYPAIGFPVGVDVADAQKEFHDSEADAIKTIFQSYGKKHGSSWEWRYIKSDGAPVSRIVQTRAHTADLIVLSLPSPDASFLEPDMMFESLLMGSGRPLLLVPDACDAGSLGQNTLIAWNGTKEAARAAFDALPAMLATESGRATVIWLDPPTSRTSTHELAGAELATGLARHGLNVTASCASSAHASVGADLLERCKRGNVDLLVMGGFGHSRIREFVLGGATDHVLRHAHIPVLMSH